MSDNQETGRLDLFPQWDYETLLRRLAEAESALQAMIAGEVDAVLDTTSISPILLREAQKALVESKKELEAKVAERTEALIQTNEQLRITNEALQLEIAERKQAEEQLNETNRLLAQANQRAEAATAEAQQRAKELEAIFNSMAEGVTVFDAQGDVLKANAVAFAALGYDPTGEDRNALIEQNSLSFPDGTPLQENEFPIGRVLRGETVQGEHFVFTSKEGKRSDYLVTASPLIVNQKMTGVVSIWRDITEHMLLVEENERNRELLEQKNQSLDRQRLMLQQQNELLLTIFDTVPGGLAVLAGEHQEFQFTNAVYRSLTPHPEIDPVGRTFQEIWPSEEGLEITARMKDVLKSGSFIDEVHHRRVYPDGSTRYFSFHVRRLSWGDGLGVLTTLWDMTALEEAQQKAKTAAEEAHRRADEAEEARRILEALMEYVPDGITIADAAHVRIRMVSKFGQQLTGRPKEAIEDIPLHEHPEQWQIYHLDGVTLARAEELALTRATLSGEVITNEEWLLQRANGELISILCNAGPIRDRNGNITGGVIVWRDITDRKNAEDALRLYADQLERANRELKEFAFISSHDLQEPLRKIQAFGNLLKNHFEHRLGVEGQDYIERMQSAAARMQNMIEDLLSYSRVTTQDRLFEQVDLNKVAQEVVSDLEIRILQTGGQVVLSDLPVIEADPMQMRQLFQNLIGNALKFHRQDMSPVVKVYSQQIPFQNKSSRKRVQIIFEDNGIGFDEQYLEQIFQPFQRLHGKSEYGGTGIGLAICRKIVERHGGGITARSKPGQGTAFIVTLPAGKKNKS